MGSIDIVGENRDNIDIKAEITIYSNTKGAAEEYSKNVAVKVEKTEESIRLSLPTVSIEDRSKEIRGVEVDYIIKAPEEMYLDISNKYGKLRIEHFKNGVDLSNKYKGSVIKDISGDEINIKGKYGSLDLQNITKGKVMQVDVAYNELEIKNIDRDLDFDADYTEIEMSQVTGEIKGDMRYGKIEINDIKNNVEFEGRYTDMDIELSEELKNYQLECETEYGDINTDLPVERDQDNNTRTASYRKGRGDIEIDLETEYADIKVE